MNGSPACQLLSKGPAAGPGLPIRSPTVSGHGPYSSEHRAEQTADQLAPITERDHSRAMDAEGQQCQIADSAWRMCASLRLMDTRRRESSGRSPPGVRLAHDGWIEGLGGQSSAW